MPERTAVTQAFLQRAGWGSATRRLLAGDASARRYDRLVLPDTKHTAVLMDAPADQGQDVRPFINIAAALRNRGFSAPEILYADGDIGLVLLEDLGDDLFARLCRDDPTIEATLYQSAVDVLLAIHQSVTPKDLAAYSPEIYRRESRLVSEWYLPAVTGKPCEQHLHDQLDDLITASCAALTDFDPVFVLRDYHTENLLWLPARKNLQKVGLLDFQDALAGHPAYDLMSLLEDARRDTSDELQQAMIQRYLQGSGFAEDPFRRAYATLGAQRNLKIIGIFSRLCLRDKKPAYVHLIPRVWTHLQRDLSHPALAKLKEFVDNNIPPPTPELLQNIQRACP